MAEKRDYYEVLGLSKGASADEIKSAYRKAALKWHPDRWVSGTDAEKKTAEEKFKEASEAYSVLSDPDKKARYDQFGFAGVDGAGAGGGSEFYGTSLNDLLRNIFGNFGGGFSGFDFGFGGDGRQQSARGEDIGVKVRLTLEEINSGCTKEIQVDRYVACKTCGGRGAVNPSDIKVCPTCHGQGQVQQSGGFFGMFTSFSTCPNCKGRGKVVTKPCSDCRGQGVVRKRDTLRVNIPAGIENGAQIPIRGEGNAPVGGGVNGDLYVVVEAIPHARFKRDGANLFYTRVISVTDAILGCEVEIPCLGGSESLRLDPGTQSGTVKKLRGKGLPVMNGYGRGDVYVKILVWIPHKLDRDEKKAIEAMRDSKNFKPSPNRDDETIFEKESRFF